ncbi:MAG: enoyl-CoA hydratase-related protein [Methanobacteriota archaeon]
MNFDRLIVEKGADSVAVVTINKPKVLNALDTATVAEIEAAFTELGRDDSVRCIILTGAGEKAFVAGGDIAEMSVKNPKAGKEYGLAGQSALFAIERCPKPVIAAINGYALGGGTEIAMACDIRIASDKAIMGQPEVGLGITPGFAGTQRLPRLVNRGRGKELLMSAEAIGAAEALRIGLVEKVVPHERLMEVARRMAECIAAKSPLAVSSAKGLINLAGDVPLEPGCAAEAEAFGACFSTGDQKEGMAAFLDKRKQAFKGA